MVDYSFKQRRLIMIKKRKLTILYTLLWVIYYLQSFLNFEGSYVSQILLASLLIISFNYFYKVNFKLRQTNGGIKAVNTVLFLVALYGFLLIIGGEDVVPLGKTYVRISRFYYLKAFLISLLPVYFFYYQFKKEPLAYSEVLPLFCVFTFLFVLQFYNYASNETADDEEKEIVNNMGYYFLSLIPLLYLIRKKVLLKYGLMVMIMSFIMMSLKRGAIVVGSISYVLFVINSLKSSSKRFRLVVLFASFFTFYLLYDFILDFYQNSELFQLRLEQTIEGNSSNRDYLYSEMLLGFINNTDLLNQLFGSGACATIKLYGGYAHSDWLEFLINQGILGVAIYLLYWFLLYERWRKTNGPISLAFGAFLVIYYMSSIYSMSINDYSICSSLCLGYFLSRSETNVSRLKRQL